MTDIRFGVWAPSEAEFWSSWVARGICTEPGVFAPAYAGCLQTTARTWPGVVFRTQPVVDVETHEIVTPAEVVPGWHCNVIVTGALVEQFTAGCPATGTIWERTHAAAVFGLTEQPEDPETGFPAGMRSAAGVTYCDAEAFTSPANVWA